MRRRLKILFSLRFRSRHRLYAIMILVLISLISMYTMLMDGENEPQRKYHKQKIREQVQIQLPAVIRKKKEIQCEIPKLDPFSEEVMKFHEETPKIQCEGVDWVECKESKCAMKREILKDMQDILCTYQDIIYKDDRDHAIGDPVRVLNDEAYYLTRSDFVKVSCYERSTLGLTIISNRWHGYMAGLRPVEIPNSEATRETINVMILCFDSASHNGFIRKMPHSYETLTKELGATVLNGYNIVGDGTSAAIIPLLFGKTELDFVDMTNGTAKGKSIDPEDIIFRKLRRYGYRTAYYEDMPEIGTFQFRFQGFKSQPADHYMRSFFLEESKNGMKWWNGLNRRHCVGSVPQYGVMLNITKQLLDLKQKHFCFTFIGDISHDDFNWISNADDDLVAFLRHLKDSGKLLNHLVIVMGDHGARYYKQSSLIRETYQGKIEERLPLMAIILPEILKRKRPEALINFNNNHKLLTTPYDIHSTVLDAMGLDELINNYSIPGSNLQRGLSLLEPIPKSRTCAQAGVLSHWCVCTKWHNVSEDEAIYTKVVHALANYINDLTMEVRFQCMERQLTSAEWVLRETTDELQRFYQGRNTGMMKHKLQNVIKAQPSSEIYQAKIIMRPGTAVFEGSMKYIVKEDKFVISEGDISRINGYGDEPRCISATYVHLKKYCFCK